MKSRDLEDLHTRIRRAELPGYCLTYNEGANQFSLILYGHDGEQKECGDHSWDVMVEWAGEQLTAWGA